MSNVQVASQGIDVQGFILNFTSEHTRRAYLGDLEDFNRFLLSHGRSVTHPSQLVSLDFVAYRDSMIQQGLAPKTTARRLASVRGLMTWFHQNGQISSNPAASLKVPRSDVTTATNALTDAEVREMLSAATDPVHKLILYFLFMLGLRSSELLSIQAQDIYSTENGLCLRVRGKGGKLRELPFNTVLELLLKQTELPSEGPIFKLSYQTLYRLFQKYAKLAGISRTVTPHSARATAITKALEQGAVLNEVADMAGHSSAVVTQLYWKRRNGLKNSPVHKLNY